MGREGWLLAFEDLLIKCQELTEGLLPLILLSKDIRAIKKITSYYYILKIEHFNTTTLPPKKKIEIKMMSPSQERWIGILTPAF